MYLSLSSPGAHGFVVTKPAVRRYLSLRNFLPSLFVVAILSACGAASESADISRGLPDPTSPTIVPAPEGGPRDAGGAADAAVKATVGSPLCRRTASDCNPDDGYSSSCTVADAGDAESDPQSCRVSRTLGSSPVCAPSGKGVDGDVCSSPSECAAGFDCVDSGANQLRCRHYCCEESCSAPGANNRKMYCGIGTAMGTKIPVCMPVTSCALMTAGSCQSFETCSIVRDDGTTSCIQVGPQRVGEACDRDNCAAGLACIGSAGAQKCYKLCRESAAEDCESGERCVGGPPLFKDGGFGLCVGTPSASGKMP